MPEEVFSADRKKHTYISIPGLVRDESLIHSFSMAKGISASLCKSNGQ